VVSRGVREGVILQRSRKGQKGGKPYSGWRQINVTDANDTLQHAAFLPSLVYGIGGCVHPRDSRVCQRRDGDSGDPPHRPPWTCSQDTGHIWEEVLPRPSESVSRTLKELERQACTVFWRMIRLSH